MAMSMVGYDRDQGVHTVSYDGTRPPGTPAEPAPPGEAPETPLPDAAGEPAPSPAEPGATPSAPDTEEAALADPQPRRDRPFVARTIRENQSLRDQVSQLQAQLAYFTQQAQRTAGQPDPAPTSPQPSPSPLRPPRQEDYSDMQAFSRDVERYWRAMAAEEATQLIEQRLQARDRQEQERQVQRVQAHLSLKLHEGRTTFDDFDDALAILDAALTGQELYGVLKQHVAQSPHGAALLRHVGLHPLVMQELQDRTPDGALRYLQSLEAQLGAPPPSPPGRRPSPPSPPRAPLPPPVHPLNGGGGLQTPMGTAPGDIVERQGSFRDYVRAVNQARTR